MEGAAIRVAGPPTSSARCSVPDARSTACEKVDTGGYKVMTTLDWKMQKIAEKWVYVAARAPNAKNPRRSWRTCKIPRERRSWILGLRGHEHPQRRGRA